MQVTVEIPEALSERLAADGKDPARFALEALAVEGYRSGQLTEGQVRRMLGMSTRMQVHALLASHDVPLNYTLDHLEMDIAAADSLHAEWQRSQ